MAAAIGYTLHRVDAASPHHVHEHARLHAAIIGTAMTAAVLLGIGHPDPAEPLAADSVSAIRAAFEHPPEAHSAEEDLVDRIATLQEAVTGARTALIASEGRVLDETARSGLEALVRSGDESIRSARVLTAISAPGAPPDLGSAADATQLELATELRTATAAVGSAVAAWEAEQARIAAEKEAARLAAEAAARAQVRVRPAGAAVVAGPYVEGIWTSGGQAEIDACRGSVNLPDIAGYLGSGFYAAEHWSCGGRAWSGIDTGELVSFPGFGTYQVAGRVGGLPSGSYASSIPAGYDGYYQTCMNGNVDNLHVWMLTRVG